VLFEHGAIGQVVVERHAGVLDEGIERVDRLDRSLDLCWIGDLQVQGVPRPSARVSA
jgi:hypothetical protein